MKVHRAKRSRRLAGLSVLLTALLIATGPVSSQEQAAVETDEERIERKKREAAAQRQQVLENEQRLMLEDAHRHGDEAAIRRLTEMPLRMVEATHEEQYIEWSGLYARKLRPEEIHYYVEVRSFFSIALYVMTAEPVPMWYHFHLKDLGIEPATEAADAFTLAVLDYEAMMEETERDDSIDGLDRLELRAARLGAIYGELLNRLELRGVSADLFDSLVKEDDGVSPMVLDDKPLGPSLPFFERMRAFDREFARARTPLIERVDEKQ